MMFSTLHDTAVQLQTAATSTSLYGTLLLETEYNTYIGVTASICHCTYFKKDFNLDLFREGFGSVVYHVHINYIKHAPHQIRTDNDKRWWNINDASWFMQEKPAWQSFFIRWITIIFTFDTTCQLECGRKCQNLK